MAFTALFTWTIDSAVDSVEFEALVEFGQETVIFVRDLVMVTFFFNPFLFGTIVVSRVEFLETPAASLLSDVASAVVLRNAFFPRVAFAATLPSMAADSFSVALIDLLIVWLVEIE